VLFDHTLEQLEDVLDPLNFFRINRKYIITFNSINDIITISGSRLKLKLRNCDDDDIYVSRDRMQEFKDWLDR
jgi:DNA-binding LytR/AlgR family response regulator